MTKYLSSYLSTALFVARDELGTDRVAGIRRSLTFVPRHYPGEDKPDPIPCYDDTVDGFIGLPISWGLRYMLSIEPGFIYRDDTNNSSGKWMSPCLPNPDHKDVENPDAQRAVMKDMWDYLSDHHTCLVRAPTGTGKTACGLWLASTVGAPTVVISHLDHILDHWTSEAEVLLGLDPDQIGRVQGPSSNWRDKAIVVCTTQTLIRRQMDPDFYHAFSLMILDEVHRFGSREFSRVNFMFSASRRLGISATPTRRDDTRRIITAHLGPIQVDSDAEAMRMTIHVLRYRRMSEYWGKKHGGKMMCVSRDRRRNQIIVSAIKRMYAMGRNILVVSDRIEHLERLKELLSERGVPENEMGQYTRTMTYWTDMVTAGRSQRIKKRRTVKKAELTKIKDEARIILATYHMLTEGFNLKRLDAGMDATPRSDATQLIGRVRRPMEGKPMPMWVTIRDLNDDKLEGYFYQRLTDYRSTNTQVVEHEHEYN